MSLLLNKKAVITGGSDGIGLSIAKAFVENGADVLLVARNPDKLARAKALLAHTANGREIHCLVADLADDAALTQVAEQILALWDGVDVLVNNAGMAKFSPFAQVSYAEWQALLNLNVKAMYFLSQRLLSALLKNQGNIINLSSYFSHRMLPGRPSTAYSLTKGAVDAFTKALAFELGPQEVRVNAIAPGTVETELVRGVWADMTAEALQQFQNAVQTNYPLGRIGQPEDLGGAAVYLASDAARWVTGVILSVDGGLTTH